MPFGKRCPWLTHLLFLCLFITAAVPVAAAEGHPTRLLLILDASGSMWGQVDGENKIVIARRVLGNLIAGLPHGTEAGLIAYGHRKKANVGEALAAAIARKTGLPTRHQDLTYDLRSGNPDAIDKVIANTFGTLAVDLIAQGKTDQMVCLQGGLYAHTALPDPAQGARTVELETYYNADTFRPRFSGLFGRQLFF